MGVSGKGAKAKGSRAELQVAKAYRRSGLFPNATRMPLSGAMAHYKGDISKGEYDNWVDEVKNQERVQLWSFWDQTVAQCGMAQHPVLHVTGNFRPILSVIRLEDYINFRVEIKDLNQEVKELKAQIRALETGKA